MREVRRIEFQSEPLRFFNHPMQRLICRPVWRITAADVAVHSWEPGLHELASPAGWPRPDVRNEGLASLVNRECLHGVLDRKVQANVVVFVLLVRRLWPKNRRT